MTPAHSHFSHPKYRPDIDGLRAVAVLSVVAFHAFPAWLKGGFIGVDVFFVISGYLISTIIFENLDRGTFSFSGFYARRIKRIFPALILVLAASYALGWFSLFADEYKQLGKHIAASAGFVSNFVLWSEAGYFDNSAETKPLLHLWSLGIEEQFYIVWPLLLWFAWKRRFHALAMMLLVAIVSFYLNLKGVAKDSVAAFYSPQTRFWELSCGSLLAWAGIYRKESCASIKTTLDGWLRGARHGQAPDADGQRLADVLSFVGIFLLGYGFWRIGSGLAFPGKWAVVPVLGAALLIAAGQKAWVNRVVLSNKVAVWFGLISFPLYLWHWSLLSFARIVESDVPGRSVRMTIIVLSIVLAWATYSLVEKRIRLGGSGRAKVAVLVMSMLVIGYIGYNTYARNGLAFRDVVKINASIKTGEDGGPGPFLVSGCGSEDSYLSEKVANCVKDSRGPSRYALLGDSKAGALFPGLIRTSSEKGRWLFIGGNGPNGAPVPVISESDLYKSYMKLSVPAIHSIADNKEVETVVLVAATRVLFRLANDKDIEDLPASRNYGDALSGLKSAVEVFEQAGKKVVLVVDNPTLPKPQDCLARKTTIELVNSAFAKDQPSCILPLSRHRQLSALYRKLLEEVRASFPHTVRVFDTTGQLCDVEKNICTHTKSGRFLYSYSDHISDYASGLIGTDLNAFLDTQ